jgi:hypothetical protein
MGKVLKEKTWHASLTCNKCLQNKPVSDFQKCRGSASGYQVRCRICQNLTTKSYRERTHNAYWRHKQGTPYSIYTITNPAGESYVGYTGTKPNVRWALHRASFKHGECKLVKLHESFVKYGVDAHTFEVIENVATRLDAMARETVLILQYRAQGKDLNTNLSTFRIGQYTKKGELIKEWDSVKEAAKSLGVNPIQIRSTVRGSNRRGTSSGYLWKVLPFKDGTFYDPKTKTFTPAIENAN